MIKAVVLWVIGLFTIVPYSIYYLFFEAVREQYAFLITLILFWIFGYWGIVAPLLAAKRVYGVMRAIESAEDSESMKEILHCEETTEAAIDLIASDNRIPHFLAARIYHKAMNEIRKQGDTYQEGKNQAE